MALHHAQFDAVSAIMERRPYSHDVLGDRFTKLATAVRTGLTGVPDAMKEGLKGTGISSLYGIS
jgi:hypothetical protein